MVLHFKILGKSKATEVEKLRPNFALFTLHVKIMEGMGDRSEFTFQAQPRPKPLIYF